MVSRTERNIVKEIMRECYPKHLSPNENFVMFIVQLFLLDPNWGITENLLTSRSNVQDLVKYIINQLQNKKSVVMVTLKMQFYFIWNMENLENVLANNNSVLRKRLSPIREQICLTNAPSTEKEMDTFKRLIVVYVIFLSGLGNPLKDEVFLEGLVALKSIMTDDELIEFCSDSKEQKVLQMEELAKIIAGIRLFNKYCDKGGAGIPDLSHLFKTALQMVKAEMELSLGKISYKVNILTSLFEKIYVLKSSGNTLYFENVLPYNYNKEFIEICKDALVHYRQYELFIRKILRNLELSMEKVYMIEDDLESLLRRIARNVTSRLAVPVTIIFPLFNQLSNLWTSLQNQVVLLSRYSSIISNLETKSVHIDQSLLQDLLNMDFTTLRGAYLEENTDVFLFDTDKIKVVYLDDEDIELQYLGFCCWKLVESNGVLIPGNPKMGVAFYNDMYFAFSSLEAYTRFAEDPDEYIKRILHLSRQKPQLINFLLLHKQLLSVSNVKKLVEERIVLKRTEDKAVQSEEDYLLPPSKDSHIKWNIWDLKRDILLLCNLRKCTTTCAQTVKTFSTNSIGIGTYKKKDEEVQTLVDKYTSTPTTSSHMYGLRGRTDNKQVVLNITRSVEQ